MSTPSQASLPAIPSTPSVLASTSSAKATPPERSLSDNWFVGMMDEELFLLFFAFSKLFFCFFT
jgi:hypothetical protein